MTNGILLDAPHPRWPGSAARAAVFPAVAGQRCQFHLQQIAGQYLPNKALKKSVAVDIRAVSDAPDHAEAKRLIERFVQRYQIKAPKVAGGAETALSEGLAVLALPPHHRKRLRTSNAIELLNRELKRRTRVATLFPNDASCLRLVTAVAMEISQDWQPGGAISTSPRTIRNKPSRQRQEREFTETMLLINPAQKYLK
ncbi:IS406 transposase [Salinisphaera hydrothermalis EPR70]